MAGKWGLTITMKFGRGALKGEIIRPLFFRREKQ
ncbi:hypothetical protein MTAT_07900 [Moorella thermoacetica]|uniref:Uncharacterized protein n=1 Tax=Neomoorella thermoacetica TaxID=1525 RepID=A0A5D3I490_NEOTH|nr:hypothetical protein Maut_01712 [Moorella thermoacetica]OIQ11424.1 hypothetical protein MOOTH_16260 [Moorella thermoacetica]OIQ61394.1 hypothetical protein MTIN_14700 [Moorella thermoacetica]TYL14555.1 hypothetical protein MTAT_07900 [Moorella thermoacetica]